jgi:hypothetical protein
MKRITFLILLMTFLIALMTTRPVAAQMTWKDVKLYFRLNQNLTLPLILKGDSSSVWVEQGFTAYAPKPVTGDSNFDLIKKGGGRFWFRADSNFNFSANIVYKEKADTVQVDGVFGPYVNDSIGYLYTGNLISSNDSISFFYLNQKDTVVQTFVAKGYNNRNINLHIYNATKSKLRLTRSSDSLAGKVDIPHGGTLYIDGAYNARVFVKGGKLITGEDSIGGNIYKDYAKFSEFVNTNASTFTDMAAIVTDGSIMQIGAYNNRPSLVLVDSGNIIQMDRSVLEIDVYNPNDITVFGNKSDISGESIERIDTAWAKSFSDRIYLKTGDYKFEQPGDTIKARWSPEYIASIAGDTVFYLPVIMLRNPAAPQQITGEDNVTVKQSLPGWVLEFYIGEASNERTQQGWGYIRGRKILMKKNAILNGVQDNGTYPNPVSVLFKDTILYELTVHNPGELAEMTIIDTLPPYLDYVPTSMGHSYSGSGSPTFNGEQGGATPGNLEQHISWLITNVPSLDTVRLQYKATPASGACASQPLYINMAYIKIKNILGDSAVVETNRTYHQGAGISVVIFSASVGGQLFNAREQALDYRTSPRSGILTVPDSGYTFAGWSHDEYMSLRGEKIEADSGLMYYGDIVVYGNVELRANFVPIAEKSGEKTIVQEKVTDNSDKVWSYDKDLYIRAKKGTITRIYTTEGILQRQLTVTADGTATVRLERGVYVVTLDGGAGWKIVIE